MKRILIHFFLCLCLASFVFGALTLSSAVPSAHAQSGPITVEYFDSGYVDYHFEQCIPMILHMEPAHIIIVNEPARALLFPTPNCQGPAGPSYVLHPGLNDPRALPFFPHGSLVVYPLN